MQNAYSYEKYGVHSDVLKKVSIPIPDIENNEVLIKVKASAINPVDFKLMEGFITMWPQSFPIIPGWDVSGVIEKSNCKNFKVGDEVFSYTRPAFDLVDEHPECKSESIGLKDGTHTSYVAVKSWKVAKKPNSLSLEEASAIPLAALTAYQALHDKANIDSTKTVLILAASGGVGSYAVGIAKSVGANVIGTCSERNFEYVKSLGADDVRDYNNENYLDNIKADIVFDCAGGKTTLDGLEVLKDDGIIVSIVTFDIKDIAAKQNKNGEAFLVRPTGEQLTIIGKLVDDGKVKIPKVNTLSFDKINEAFSQIKSSRTVGKIVLVRE